MPESTALAAPGHADPMVPRPFIVTATRRDSHDTATLWLRDVDGLPLEFAPGQFTMLHAFGVGEVPISISGDSADPTLLMHTIRDVGGVTASLVAVEPGDVLGVRGPYGVGWEVGSATGGDLVIVTGGIGLAPLRPAILQAIADRDSYGRVVVVYGARTPGDILFGDEFDLWRARDVQVEVTVDQATSGWSGRVGLVTEPLAAATFDPLSTSVLMCGPEVMMRVVGVALRERGVVPERVRVSLERNMRCGVGLCGHCQLREFLICIDGPCFPLDAVSRLMAVRDL